MLVTDVGLAHLASLLRQLTSLDANKCNVTDAAFASFGCMHQLRALHLRECPYITGGGLDQLASLLLLETLGLARCKLVTDAGIVSNVTALDSLHHLNLSGCSGISDVGVVHVAQRTMPQLRRLILRELNQVTDTSLRQLASLTHLCLLDVSRCNVTREEMTLLRARVALVIPSH